jgi:hypothetical protein
VAKTLPLAFARPEDPLLGATLTAVLMGDGPARIDEALLHGRSDVQRGIRFTLPDPDAAPPGSRTLFFVWVALKGGEGNLAYHGVAASKEVVHRQARLGWRDLPQEVNAMGEAARGGVHLELLPASLFAELGRFLVEKGHGAWERAPESFRAAFAAAAARAEERAR